MIQKQIDHFLIELQAETNNNIMLGNALILFRKGIHLNSHFEQAECYTKIILLLNSMGKVNKNIEKLIEKCQQYLNQFQMNHYRLNDCKLKLNESLEQIHHIDKLKEKMIFQQKDGIFYLQKEDSLHNIYFLNLRYLIQNLSINIRQLLFKNAVAAIDKVNHINIDRQLCNIDFTPEAEIASLSQELKQQFMLIYKDYLKQKNKVNDDLLYYLQMFFQSASFLNELTNCRKKLKN